jgi:hypothetical protein
MGQPSNLTLWKRPLSPCHPDRSAAQWRDLRFSGPFLEMFFDKGIMGLWTTQGDEKRPLNLASGMPSKDGFSQSATLSFVNIELRGVLVLFACR